MSNTDPTAPDYEPDYERDPAPDYERDHASSDAGPPDHDPTSASPPYPAGAGSASPDRPDVPRYPGPDGLPPAYPPGAGPQRPVPDGPSHPDSGLPPAYPPGVTPDPAPRWGSGPPAREPSDAETWSYPPSAGSPSPSVGPPAAAFPPANYPPETYGYAPPTVADATGYGGAGGAAPLPGGGSPPPMSTRLVARIIDGVVMGMLYVVVAILGLTPGDIADRTAGAPDPVAVGAWMSSLFLFVVLGVCYEVVLIALRGATIGKQVMKLRVVRADSGALPGFGPSLARWVPPALANMLCPPLSLVIYLSPFWADRTGRQRGYHDQLAGTVVINAR